MPGMLGNHQDFFGQGEPHPDWDLGYAWSPYYAVYIDGYYQTPFWRQNTGDNPSYCPEMTCGPPEVVVANVQGFGSVTRIPHDSVVSLSDYEFYIHRGSDCYAYNSCCDSLFEDDPDGEGGDLSRLECFNLIQAEVRCSNVNPSILNKYIAGRFYTRDIGADICDVLYNGYNNFIGSVLYANSPQQFGVLPCWSGAAYDWVETTSFPMLWPNIAFNGDIPKYCTYAEYGNAFSLTIDLTSWFFQDDSPFMAFWPCSKNRVNVKERQPHPFDSSWQYIGELTYSDTMTWEEVKNNSRLNRVLDKPTNAYSSYIGGIFLDSDYNGQYTCYKSNAITFSRPELTAVIAKTIIEPSGYPIENNAELVFEVNGRESWRTARPCCQQNGVPEQLTGFNFQPFYRTDNPNDPPPEDAECLEGKFYSIDYACGPRLAPVANDYPELELPDGRNECLDCYQFYCTERVGTAKPHLAAFPNNHDNTSAEFKINLRVNQWMMIRDTPSTPDDLPNINYLDAGNKPLNVQNLTGQVPYPYTWVVDSIEILQKGADYTINDFFEINFDPNWFLPLVSGQAITVFPDIEQCFPGPLTEDITWSDKYGYTKPVGSDQIVLQRFKVNKVDNDGGILDIEIVPWYKTPEFIPAKPYLEFDGSGVVQVWSACAETNNGEKTPYYVEYFRVLCHPNSVRHPGKGYSVGDSITWKFDPDELEESKIDQGKIICDVIEQASGIVVDVDENGGILDWYIGGSDRWRQFGVYNLGQSDALCKFEDEVDTRGSYRFTGDSLCSLFWNGIGPPIRKSSLIPAANTSVLSFCDISISRTNCRTTATIAINLWPYSERSIFINDSIDFNGANTIKEGTIAYYKTYFPLYPQCFGGGVEIEIEFGTENANDSVFGSTVKAANIISSGTGYAYKEKSHQQPILPTKINGGAELSYTFEEVINFPHPNVLSNTRYNLDNPVDPYRFAYFPVSDVSIINPGSGYEIGQEIDIKPIGGSSFIDPWSQNGGDDPDTNPNGSWYDGRFSTVDQNGYMKYDENETFNDLPFSGLYPYLTIVVTDLTEVSGIQNITIKNKGMMYRSLWTQGKLHPDVMPVLDSSLGYGAVPEMIINTDMSDSEFFGSVTDYWFRGATVDELPDPYYYTQFSTPEEKQQIPGNANMGFGRDYANPEHGYYWQLQDIGIADNARLLAYYPWGIHYNSVYTQEPLHYLGESSDFQTHKVITGSAPPFVPMSTVCSFSECYHDLINKTYPVYRSYYTSRTIIDPFDCSATYEPFTSHNSVGINNPPITSYCVAMKKQRSYVINSTGELVTVDLLNRAFADCIPQTVPDFEGGVINVGQDIGVVGFDGAGIFTSDNEYTLVGSILNDYYVVEYGMSISLSSQATECKHSDGRTVQSSSVSQFSIAPDEAPKN